MRNTIHIDKEELAKAYTELGSITAICKKYRRDKSTIKRLFALYNIKTNRPNYTFNESFFLENTEATFYVAGFLAADGGINEGIRGNNKRCSLSLCLAEKDSNHIYKIRDLLQSNHKIRHSSYFSKQQQKYNDVCIYEIYSKNLIESLKRFNIVPKKSLIYTLPEKLVDHPMIRHFIRGYIDGDGCWQYNNHPDSEQKPNPRMSILGTESFLKTINYLFNKNCNVNTMGKKINKLNNIYKISYGGTQLTNKIISYLYDNAIIYLDRKKEITDQIRTLLTYNTGRNPNRATEITVPEIINAAHKSKTQVEMAKILNCWPTNISSRLRINNIKEEIQEILRQNRMPK